MASFFIARYANEHNVNLLNQISHTVKWFESFFVEQSIVKSVSKPIIPIHIPEKKLKPNAEQEYRHVEIGHNAVCKDTSLGELQLKKTGQVYTWTDDEGVLHFSDTPPGRGNFESLDYAKERVFDYFSLNLNTDNLPYDFNQKLTVKLNKLFKLYGNLLDRSLLKKVDINLQVYRSNEAFEALKQQHNFSRADSIRGFYSHANNKAYLLFRNNDQTMKTATHEATHAINRAIIGYTPRWLNEGLAEYSEYIQVAGHSATIFPNDDWTKKFVITKTLLPLSELFSANRTQWNSDLTSQLYATSWAFVYFMMEHPQRKEILAKYIKREQQNLCDVIDKNKVIQHLEIPLDVLQKQFSKWSSTKLNRQAI